MMDVAPDTVPNVRTDRVGGPLPVLAIGSIAARALARSHGRAEPLAAFPEAPYLRAADEIIWVGVRPRSMHPRMVALAAPIASGTTITFDSSGVAPSPNHQHRPSEASTRTLISRAEALRSRLTEVGPPRGFAPLLVERTPAFPLDLATPIVRRFVAALRSNDHDRIEATAVALLGLGSGLTPSGDDLVGGALFARGLVAPHDVAWQRLGERLIAVAPTRTHEISVALLADLTRGARRRDMREQIFDTCQFRPTRDRSRCRPAHASSVPAQYADRRRREARRARSSAARSSR